MSRSGDEGLCGLLGLGARGRRGEDRGHADLALLTPTAEGVRVRGGLLGEGLLVLQARRLGLRLLTRPVRGLPTRLGAWSRTGDGG